MINYRGLNIPKVSFGNLDSDALFCDKEQPLFDFYEASKDRYTKALDIGANIGVHSILMRRQGWAVRAFEPDPDTYALLAKNTADDTSVFAEFNNSAVSDHNGTEIFVRVKGNTTGSHLKGDKKPYGELEEFTVTVVDCRPLFAWADFAKIDCEGHEARLLKTVTEDCRCEFMVEVGSASNAQQIWEHFFPLSYQLWSQKRGWQPCRWLKDLPLHHSDGALFIGRSAPFPAAP